jgi:hypothetical protein
MADTQHFGQTRDVYVYYPVVTAPDFTTFDVKLHKLLAIKRELAGGHTERLG